MKNLVGSIVGSIAAAAAWNHRSKLLSAIGRDSAVKDPPLVPPTGYGETVGDDALVDPADVN